MVKERNSFAYGSGVGVQKRTGFLLIVNVAGAAVYAAYEYLVVTRNKIKAELGALLNYGIHFFRAVDEVVQKFLFNKSFAGFELFAEARDVGKLLAFLINLSCSFIKTC